MRYLSSLFCALVLAAGCSLQASEGFDDLVKLAKSGSSEEVMLAYIEASTVAYQLSVDEILFLNDLGVPANVISEAVRHGKLLRDIAAKNAPEASVPPPAVPPEVEQALAQVAEPAAPAAPAAPVAPAAPQPPVQPAVVNDPAVQDPVIGKPEPIRPAVAEAAPPVNETIIGPAAEPAPEPQVVEREVIREVIVERPAPVIAPPPERLNVSFFYESLSPYGSWILVDDEWCWQPTVVVVDRTWRPYSNRGRWVYTDCGWAWHSDYSWGWAAFHYGRWEHHHRHGWIWAPDTVWGPAWVSWRYSDSHCGWAPLPRGARYETGVGFSYRGKNVGVDFHFGLRERDYFFVPTRHVCDTGIHRYGVPPAQVTNVYNTTIIQNNYVYNDNRIINNGVPVDRVRRASNRDIQ